MNTCRNIRFIASAGTGKTHQVVSLYQSLLFGRPYPPAGDALPGTATGSIFDGNSRIAPEHILMLTFTKNAAAEMRSRVTEAIEHELASDNPDNEAFCWSLLRRLSAATISTIHSFAQQLLAAHTLHLGLAPNLKILEEADAADLRQNAIESALKAALTGSNDAYVHDLELLCDGRGITGIKDGIINTLRSCSAWGLDLTATSPANLVTQPSPPTAADLTALIKKLEASTWQKSKKRDAVLAVLSRFTLHASLPIPHEPRTLNPEPSSLASALEQSSGTWGKTDDIKALKRETEDTLSFLASYPERVEATRLLISFLTLARNSSLHIQGLKRSLGVLDFDDLLFKARDLVRSRPSTVPEIKVIIVDEAQDNSHLQNELIHLVQSASNADMVMCGDTKQTIYGWRGADPNGLPTFAKTMSLSAIPLRTSYRSQKGILDWVNDIFAATVLGPSLYGEAENLSPCPAAKSLKGPSVELLLPDWEAQPNPRDNIVESKDGLKPRITITRSNLSKQAKNDPSNPQWQTALDQSAQAIALEARAIARRIRLLTTPVTDPQWHPARVWNAARGAWIKAPAAPYRFRDILILLRAGTLQEVYEQALQEEGIPFTTDGKGRGFFARQETLDVSNLLSWLANPNDRLAWLGLLRSPFVALSDNAIALLEFENQNQEGSFSQKPQSPLRGDNLPAAGDKSNSSSRPSRTSVQTLSNASSPAPLPIHNSSFIIHNSSPPPLSPSDASALQHAAPILERLHLLAGRISAVELVREAVRLTGYDAILAGTFHGVQRLANLQKLLTWLQARERDETLNLQQTARRLSDEITRGRDAPDAAVLDPDDDSVRINTIHAAKGLSSPVVILPDLRRQPASDRDWILVVRNESGEASTIAGKLKQYTNDTSTELASEQFEGTLARNKADRDSESRRLFYVACTRARDLLILSGENPSNGSENAWRTWLNRHLIQCDFNPALITLHPYGAVEQAWRKVATPIPAQPIPNAAAFQSVTVPESAKTITERYRFPVTTLTSSSPFLVCRRLGEAGGGEDHGEGDSPSSTHSLLVTHHSSLSPDDHESREPITPRSQAGTIAHRILETLDYSVGQPYAAGAPGHGPSLPLPLGIAEQINHSPEWTNIPASDRKRIQTQVQSAATAIYTMLSSATHQPSTINHSPSHPTSPIPHPTTSPSALSSPLIRELPFAALFSHDNAQVIVDGKVDLLFYRDNRWHLVDYKFSDLPPAEVKARYANQLYIYREALSAPVPHTPPPLPRGEGDGARVSMPEKSGLRTPRFSCTESAPAEWKLILLSINSSGLCIPIDIDGEPKADLSAQLIQSARLCL